MANVGFSGSDEIREPGLIHQHGRGLGDCFVPGTVQSSPLSTDSPRYELALERSAKLCNLLLHSRT